LLVSNFDAMQAFQPYLLHFLRDCTVAVLCQPIRADPYQEVRILLSGCAEEFIDIALPVSYMNAPLRLSQKRGRLLEVFQPADTLLLLNRNPRVMDLLLKSVSSLELLSCPKLCCGNSQGHPLGR